MDLKSRLGGGSRTLLLFSVLMFSFFLVWSYDQVHEYEDVNKKSEIPLEFSKEYSHSLRQRRDVNPTQNLSVPARNITNDHRYYKTLFLMSGNSDYWIEESDQSPFKNDTFLSNGALRSKKFELKFTFPYYGHPVTRVSITTGGFLYVGYVETRLKMKVMYVAPLMAFFNTSLSEDSAVSYFSNATQFTTQWSNVMLQNDPSVGGFTFQCTLFKDGRIAFAYKNLPIPASSIQVTPEHHVKVGISDAFIGYRWWVVRGRLHRIRIFYIYHSVDYPMTNIKSNSLLIITPKLNCVIAKDCTQCLNIAGKSDFSCAWCSKLKRCSDGLDRHRMEWIANSCNTQLVSKYKDCQKNSNVYSGSRGRSRSSSGVNAGVIIAICIVLIIVIAVGAWCFYAYTHPVSRSGLWLIELRHKPAKLFRRGNEAGGSTSTGATTGSSTA